MNRLYSFAEQLSRAATWGGAALLFAAAAYITVDIILRKFMNVSLHGSDELAGYVLAISTSWGLSFSLLRRANIRIDALYMRLPKRWTVWLDLFGLIAMGIFMSFVTWFALQMALNSATMGSMASTQLRTPLVIPQAMWVAGFLLFMFVLLVLLLRVVLLLFRGDQNGISRIAGIRSVEEEMNDEVSAETLQVLKAGATDAH